MKFGGTSVADVERIKNVADIIKNKKIKDVYYCYDDPDLRSHRRAKKTLSKNNIKIKKIELIKDF